MMGFMLLCRSSGPQVLFSSHGTTQCPVPALPQQEDEPEIYLINNLFDASQLEERSGSETREMVKVVDGHDGQIASPMFVVVQFHWSRFFKLHPLRRLPGWIFQDSLLGRKKTCHHFLLRIWIIIFFCHGFFFKNRYITTRDFRISAPQQELIDLCEERGGFAPSVQRQASGDVIVDQPLACSCQFARMDGLVVFLYDILSCLKKTDMCVGTKTIQTDIFNDNFLGWEKMCLPSYGQHFCWINNCLRGKWGLRIDNLYVV